MSNIHKCLLRCVKTGREIYLDHSKEISIGRGPLTEITDSKLSKSQGSFLVIFLLISHYCII